MQDLLSLPEMQMGESTVEKEERWTILIKKGDLSEAQQQGE